MKILVTGGNGQLGRCIYYASLDSKNEYVFTGHNELDITDYESVESYVIENKIDVIVNCSAYTNVNAAEHDFTGAVAVNCYGVENLAAAADLVGAKLIHISTDFVYDGMKSTPYNENDKTNPINIYGRTKLMGEEYCLLRNKNAIILRTSWLYSPFGGFVKTIYNKIYNNKYIIDVVKDETGSPTYAFDLADAIVYIIDNNKLDISGIFNFCNSGSCSRYDLACHIDKYANNTTTHILSSLASAQDSELQRPSYSVMNNDLFENTFNYRIPYWDDSLCECIEHLKLKTFENI